MGFTRNTVKLLFYAKSKGVDFSRSLMIGRQGMHLSPGALESVLRDYGLGHGNSPASISPSDQYAEALLKTLGAEVTDSLDGNEFEGANIIQDLNLPLRPELEGKYSVVIDGGSLEHVFNYSEALKSCMKLVKPGGHFIAISPANNYFGHGFYQFSPELFYRALSPENGFEVESMIFFLRKNNASWYEVVDPMVLRQRVSLINSWNSQLFVMAKKIEDREIFESYPQQSDYHDLAWEGKSTVNNTKGVARVIKGVLGYDFHKFLVDEVLSRVTRYFGIGTGKSRFFKKIKYKPQKISVADKSSSRTQEKDDELVGSSL